VLRRLAGNSAAKAGGAEIESSILTKRFPIELFLGWESVGTQYQNMSIMFNYRYNVQVNKQEAEDQPLVTLPWLSRTKLDFLRNTNDLILHSSLIRASKYNWEHSLQVTKIEVLVKEEPTMNEYMKQNIYLAYCIFP
jgi:hypothetical protein